MARHIRLQYLAVLCLLFLTACSHTLEVKNLHEYRHPPNSPLDSKMSIGVISNATSPVSKSLTYGITAELGKYCEVVHPYAPGRSRTVDMVAMLDIRENYEGSGANFFINFPGFLVWAPAWNGYVYKANYDFGIDLKESGNNQPFAKFDVPVRLDLRHADIGRTWTEVSWFEVGAIALIGGFVFMSYDEDVTPLLPNYVGEPIGAYVGQMILEKARMYKPAAVTPPPELKP